MSYPDETAPQEGVIRIANMMRDVAIIGHDAVDASKFTKSRLEIDWLRFQSALNNAQRILGEMMSVEAIPEEDE